MTAQKSTYHILAIAVLDAFGAALLVFGLQPPVPDFTRYEAGAERKQAFFNYLLPLVEQRNREILASREQLLTWSGNRKDLGWWGSWRVESLAEYYAIGQFDLGSDDDWNTLLRRVDMVPPSLALAQAATESAWGTSRFAREGNNFYGEWCYVKGCGLVPDQREDGKYHEVADFDSPRDSVASYIHNLNYHWAYHSLRALRADLRAANDPVTGMELTRALDSYSIRGEQYAKELRSLIVFNNLSQYDPE